MEFDSKNINDLAFNGMIVTTDLTDFSHLHFFEFCYILEGVCIRHFAYAHKEKKSDMILADQYFLLEPRTCITYEETGGTPLRLIRILFPPEFLDNAIRNSETVFSISSSYLFRFNNRLAPFFDCTTVFSDTDQSIKPFFKNAVYEFNKCNYGYRELIRCYIVQTLITIMRQEVAYPQYDVFDKYIAPIYVYCREHYKENITLSVLAQKMHFSLPYISNKFKQVTGKNFRYYLQSLRMEEACRMLTNTHKSIPEVAESVGYTDSRAFNKIFKLHLGTTPLQYRKQFRN